MLSFQLCFHRYWLIRNYFLSYQCQYLPRDNFVINFNEVKLREIASHDNITKIGKDQAIFSYFFCCSFHANRPVFLENGNFNLKLYISTRLCQTFSVDNIIYLKLPLFGLKTNVSFFWNYSLIFFIALKIYFMSKKTYKVYFELFFDTTSERDKILKI